MILNLHSLAFGTETLSGGGNPAWGTEMGQGAGYRFSFPNYETFITGLVFNSIPNPQTRVYCPLGKGGNQSSDYEFVVASLFEKVYVNNMIVNGKFLLLVTKKLVGANHVGRRTLKYNPRMTIDGVSYNEECYKAMARRLNVSDSGSWFVSEINIVNQDELHFTAHVLNETQPTHFKDSSDRTAQLQAKLIASPKNGDSHNFISQTLECSPKDDNPLQVIYYGAPGTGKSFTIDKMAKDEVTVRTTFHPDSDYASFVGAYKPTMQSMAMSYISEGIAKYAKAWNGHDAQEKKIVYKYVPQAFLKAYVAAWADLDNPHYLVIEEINRGNCAQIFGDLFQLLDRNNMGSSSYAIHADEDIAQFLATDANGFAELSEEQKDAIRSFVLVKDSGERLPIGQEILDGKKLLLPPNLYIWATMNTSDQSLFPIDSAFKRRWNWRYMPIDYTKKNHTFLVGDNRYSWGEFLRKMNPTISTLTETPDKQMGYFFAKPDLKSSDAAAENDTISEEIFLNKVLFYLWTDVLKDFDAGEPFLNEDTGRAYEFSEFFDAEKNYLQKFVDKLGLEVVEVVENTKCDSGKNRSDYSTLTVSFPDGTVISEPTINDTYIKAIEKIGLERAAEAAADKKYQRRGHELISKVKYPDLEDEGYKYAQVGDYYIVLPTRSESLRGMLELMSDKFNLGLTITLE